MIDVTVEFPNLPELSDAETAKRIRTYPCHSNRLSSIGHCLRKQFYQRTRWEEAIPHDVGLERVFEVGRTVEEKTLLQLVKLPGVEVSEYQVSLNYKTYNLTGHPDWVITWNGKRYVVDCKSVHPSLFQKINTLEDLFAGKYYHRSYVYQLQGYMLISEIPQGFLLLVDKSSGQWKQINMTIDWDIAENVLKRAEVINLAIKKNIEPNRLEYCDECESCAYRHICSPTKPRDVVYDLNDPEVVSLVTAWYEADQAAKAAKDLNDQVKCICENIEHGLCGRFLITGKRDARGVWRKKIRPVNSEPSEELETIET